VIKWWHTFQKETHAHAQIFLILIYIPVLYFYIYIIYWPLLTTFRHLLTRDQTMAYISKRDACTCTNISGISLHSCVIFLYLHNILASFDNIPTSLCRHWMPSWMPSWHTFQKETHAHAQIFLILVYIPVLYFYIYIIYWPLLTTFRHLLTRDDVMAFISKRDACTCKYVSDIISYFYAIFLNFHSTLASFQNIPTCLDTWSNDGKHL